ncbi:hypothetical protein GCM10025881_15010 [Pseudolysinimonas kribbensis]|uniref:Uncharacterized protein n=1 Tax=Pseudolysinimonas kribbensis TaxID=433641 RepID=A0ABQ6K239_9MICO|nr:hypothetical protein GCM10025881_15010 [Pseudolysinimonas kribbensis]
MSDSIFTRLSRRTRKLITRLVRAWEAEVRARAFRQPLWNDTVLYESFAGNGALDNPEAIFRALLAAPDQAHLRHIWVLTRGHQEFRAEFRDDPRVRIVRHRSSGYFRAIARSRVLINNATFPHEFDKRPGQLYVNTWHGTPLKHMGYDMPDGALQSGNVLRNFLAADVLLAQSPWMTQQMYLDAYKLRGIYEDASSRSATPASTGRRSRPPKTPRCAPRSESGATRAGRSSCTRRPGPERGSAHHATRPTRCSPPSPASNSVSDPPTGSSSRRTSRCTTCSPTGPTHDRC